MPAGAAERVQVSVPARHLPPGRAVLFCKRMIDLCAAVLLLGISIPIVIICACIIKLQDGGPVFYRRRVVGPGGTFDAFKLRSMRMNGDKIFESNPALQKEFFVNFKLKNDPRVTRFGVLMRRYSLDELPQLWNVLLGQMSLVGPRMICPAELNRFGDAGWIFSCMKPGLTGYWQTEGRHELGYGHRVKMELWYAEHRSLFRDLSILLRTPLRILRGAGVD